MKFTWNSHTLHMKFTYPSHEVHMTGQMLVKSPLYCLLGQPANYLYWCQIFMCFLMVCSCKLCLSCVDFYKVCILYILAFIRFYCSCNKFWFSRFVGKLFATLQFQLFLQKLLLFRIVQNIFLLLIPFFNNIVFILQPLLQTFIGIILVSFSNVVSSILNLVSLVSNVSVFS